jgi:probable F420-dependent oxidoreductase
MASYKIGVQYHPQHTTWMSYKEAVVRAEALGVDSIWNWDHFYPLYGEADGAHFECYSLLAATAVLTNRAHIGAMVTCNSYRNPNLLADMARTIDHISGGRFILGIGSGWFQRDYDEYGYEFGTAGKRLDQLEKSLPVIIDRWARLNPLPVNGKIPILIGGGGEKKTLRMTAQYADMWNLIAPPAEFARKNQILDGWCERLGRDPKKIERTVVITDLTLIDQLDDYVAAGATHLILGLGEPWDFDALEKVVTWRQENA